MGAPKIKRNLSKLYNSQKQLLNIYDMKKKLYQKSQKYFAVMSSVRRRKKQHGDLWNSSFLGKTNK